ncbi:hypothetical protein BH11BAC2_BH11BAC2_24750 [soil metagenome]
MSDSPNHQKNNEALFHYLERGSSSVMEKFFGVISPGFHDFVMAAVLYYKLQKQNSALKAAPETVIIEGYKGDNPTTLGMRNIISAIHHPAFIAALVHGSIATDEIINYSDFDGILIIDPNKIDSRKSMLQLIQIVEVSTGHMRHRDALQHHGWSVLNVHDLYDYPDAQLPALLLKYSQCIYPTSGITLSYNIIPSHQNYQIPLFNLVASLNRKCTTHRPSTFYAFKNLLSELMLLPALYLQARDQQPVFKKESFHKAKGDFTTSEWKIIEEVSAMRLSWDQSEVKANKEKWAAHLSMIPGMRKLLQINVPARYSTELTETFYSEIQQLTNAAEQKIKKS